MRKFSLMTTMEAIQSLGPGSVNDESEDQSLNTINVLATQTDASMSSSNFAIPRRSTIDADVSLSVLFLVDSVQSFFSHIG